MAVRAYLPSFNMVIKVAIVLVILTLALKYLPVPPQVRDLFRL